MHRIEVGEIALTPAVRTTEGRGTFPRSHDQQDVFLLFKASSLLFKAALVVVVQVVNGDGSTNQYHEVPCSVCSLTLFFYRLQPLILFCFTLTLSYFLQ
mmetsp:Transcript_35369/g.91994  ORF Transcript_35369/g.91994 Transcript_35369/m.91994 type:complete len:99 (-) Transcript_35369:1437-1733(-)